MKIFNALCGIYVIFFLLFCLSDTKIKHTKRTKEFLFVLLAAALAVIAYNTIPANGWDITRHAVYLNRIRASGISLRDMLFSRKNVVGGTEYSSLITFNLLRYLISRFEDNHLLSTVFVLLDYLIVGYISVDWQATNHYSKYSMILSLLLSFTCMPYVSAVSGLRNALAASIAGLSVYMYLYKKRSIWLYIVLAFMAATIHPAALLTVPFVFLAKMNLKITGLLGVAAITALSQQIAKIMSNSSIPFLQLIGRKYYAYTSETQYVASRAPLWSILIMAAVFLVLWVLQLRHAGDERKYSDENLIFNFMGIYVAYIFGNIGNYDMVLRPAYVLGTLSPVFVSILMNPNTRINITSASARRSNLIVDAAFLICVALTCYVSIMMLIFHGKNFAGLA